MGWSWAGVRGGVMEQTGRTDATSTMLLGCRAGVRPEGRASSCQGGWPQQPEPTKPWAASQPTTLLPWSCQQPGWDLASSSHRSAQVGELRAVGEPGFSPTSCCTLNRGGICCLVNRRQGPHTVIWLSRPLSPETHFPLGLPAGPCCSHGPGGQERVAPFLCCGRRMDT